MTEQDEIPYSDLTTEERAALNEVVALLVRESAAIAAHAIRNKVDIDEV